MKELFFGKLKLKSNIFYSPLVGCSDYPFRKMSAKYQPALMFCEMIHIEPLTRGIKETLRTLAYSEEMRPIGAQICGSNPKLIGQAAKIIEDLGFDVVDFNCGCPVDHVTKDGSGSGMLKSPEKIGEMISEMRAAVKIPVTLKIRAGWDEESIVAPMVTEIAAKAGADAIFVHGRTREQAYRGPANWDHITNCMKVSGNMKVIGNGDIFAPEDALRMCALTGCDGILVSRGTMGRPWIAEDIKRVQMGLAPIERSFEEIKQALLTHLEYTKEFRSEREAVLDMRRIACWYFKNRPNVRHFRGAASQITSLEDARKMIIEFA
jgi:tRNA-dihydrouridine synthase B